MRMPKSLGTLLVAIWFILWGLLTAPFINLSFTYAPHLLAILAMVAGVLLLLERR